jgi:hypothetical protein
MRSATQAKDRVLGSVANHAKGRLALIEAARLDEAAAAA